MCQIVALFMHLKSALLRHLSLFQVYLRLIIDLIHDHKYLRYFLS
jgi:hypothetical protein